MITVHTKYTPVGETHTYLGNTEVDYVSYASIESISETTHNSGYILCNSDITSIQSNAFGDTTMTECILPVSTRIINKNAFSGDSIDNRAPLRHIVLSPNTIKICESAFAYTNLSYIDLPYGLTTIESYAFAGSTIKNVTIPCSVQTIGSYIYENSGVETVNLHDGLNYISVGMFENTTELKEIKLPSSIIEISSYAFYNDAKLEFVNLNDNLKKIGSYAFMSCNVLSDIYNINIDNITKCAIIPDKVYEIGEYAFFDSLKDTKYICIPSSTKNIKKCAFAKTNKQQIETELILNYGIEKIGDEAFKNTKIESVYIPASVAKIGVDAFSGCDIKTLTLNSSTIFNEPLHKKFGNTLTNISIDANITELDNNLFEDLKNLTTLNLPDSLYSCTEGVFNNCEKLNYAYNSICYFYYNSTNESEIFKLEDNIKNIAPQAFKNNSHLEQFITGSSLQIIGSYTFANDKNLTFFGTNTDVEKQKYSVNIQNSITTINNYAFSGCNHITSVHIPNSVTTLGKYVFSDCENLQTVVIDKGFTNIQEYCFYNSPVNSLALDYGLQNIYDYAFYGNKLTDLQLPSSVKYIGAYAFATEAHRISLKNDNNKLPEGITTICAYSLPLSYNNCVIGLPNSLVNLDVNAFEIYNVQRENKLKVIISNYYVDYLDSLIKTGNINIFINCVTIFDLSKWIIDISKWIIDEDKNSTNNIDKFYNECLNKKITFYLREGKKESYKQDTYWGNLITKDTNGEIIKYFTQNVSGDISIVDTTNDMEADDVSTFDDGEASDTEANNIDANDTEAIDMTTNNIFDISV